MSLKYESASEPLHITPERPIPNTGNIAEMLLSADPKDRPSAAETRVSAPTPQGYLAHKKQRPPRTLQ